MDGGKLLFQLLKIVFGFILALVASGIFLAWGYFRAGSPDGDPVVFAAMVGTGLVGASVIGGTVLIPASVLILLAEMMRLRGLIYCLAAGGGVAFLVWTLGDASQAAEGVRPGTAIALTAGFLGGAVYWLVAGRTAGSWRTDVPDGGSVD